MYSWRLAFLSYEGLDGVEEAEHIPPDCLHKPLNRALQRVPLPRRGRPELLLWRHLPRRPGLPVLPQLVLVPLVVRPQQRGQAGRPLKAHHWPAVPYQVKAANLGAGAVARFEVWRSGRSSERRVVREREAWHRVTARVKAADLRERAARIEGWVSGRLAGRACGREARHWA